MRLYERVEGKFTSVEKRVCPQLTQYITGLHAHVQKISQASEHLCTTKLQTRRDVCYAGQSVCLLVSSDSGVPGIVDPQKRPGWPGG